MTTYLVHEDRADHALGLQLTVLSLLAVEPGARVVVSGVDPGRLGAWVERTTGRPVLGHVTVRRGWDVKPELLLHLLARGQGPVVWVDADVVCTRPPAAVLAGPDAEFVVAEETWWSREQGTDARTTGWGWAVGRRFRRSVNSGVVRAGTAHVELLQAWSSALGDPAYVAAQALPWHRWPVHLLSDQEVLSGLLCSTRFADLPVRFLHRGRDIAQCFGASGYSTAERWATRHVPPVFVHAMGGPKPWQVGPQSCRADRRHAELSPYTAVARGLLAEEGQPWLGLRSPLGRRCRAAAGDNPALIELPLVLPQEVGRRSRQLAGRLRRATAAFGAGRRR